MNELYGLAWLGAFWCLLAATFLSLQPPARFATRLSAIRQAEVLHNVRVNGFIFLVAAMLRGLWPVAAGSMVFFIVTFLFYPQATKVQAGGARPSMTTELGFYLAFVLVLPPRLAAIAYSNGTLSSTLAVSAAISVVLALLVLALRFDQPIVQKMQAVLMPGHNILCIVFLVVVTPVIGQAPFTAVHHMAGCILLALAGVRALSLRIRQHQLAFFMHWPLPLAGGRLPVALVVLGGSFSAKALAILAVSLLVWGWAVGIHGARMEELQAEDEAIDRALRNRN
jgi:hypothetical protein